VVQPRLLIRLLFPALAACALGAAFLPAFADSTPVGSLPPGPVTTVIAARGSLVAIALPRAAASTGLVWRLARPLDPAIAREVSEADVGSAVVIVYRVAGKGRARIVYAQTRGDASSKAVRVRTTALRVS
jgi:hypothetical protein